MILVRVDNVWYRTRALSHVTLHYDIRDIADIIYNSDRNEWARCKDPLFNKELFILDGWLRNFEQYEYINTKKVIRNYFHCEY